MRKIKWIILILSITVAGFLSIPSFVQNFGYLKEENRERSYFNSECSEIITKGVLANLTIVQLNFMASFKVPSYFSSPRSFVIFTGLNCDEMKKLEVGNSDFENCKASNVEGVNVSSVDLTLLNDVLEQSRVSEFKECLIYNVIGSLDPQAKY